MKFILPGKITTWAYLVILMLGCGTAGWLLAAFHTYWLASFISLAVMTHLIMVGVDAIALANVWIILMMFIAAILKAWPEVWGSRVPIEDARLWASGLLLLWAGATVLIVVLSFAQQVVQPTGLFKSHVARKTVILSWATTFLGYSTYYLTR